MIFKNQSHQQIFNRMGFCSFTLTNDQSLLDKLRRLLDKQMAAHLHPPDKFKGTGWIENTDLRVQISNQIGELLCDTLTLYFTDFRVVGYNFLIKESGADSAVPPHQDWTYVDEQNFYSLNLWLALEDIEEKDGALQMLPFSHRIFSGYIRPAPSYPVPFKSYSHKLMPYMQTIPLKAGECVCFNNATVHASLPNLGSSLRRAVVCTLYPKAARLLHYYVTDSDEKTLTEFELSGEQFVRIPRGVAPISFYNKRMLPFKEATIKMEEFMLKYYGCRVLQSIKQ